MLHVASCSVIHVPLYIMWRVCIYNTVNQTLLGFDRFLNCFGSSLVFNGLEFSVVAQGFGNV